LSPDAGWDLGDDDLELPPEEPSAHTTGDTDYFSPPTKGTAPTTAWTNSSPLVVDHILAGSFPTAFKLLQSQVTFTPLVIKILCSYCFACSQVGIVNFEPYQQLFMSTFSRSKTSYAALSLLPAISAFPQRPYKGSNPNGRLPAVGLKLSALVQRLQVIQFLRKNCT